MGSSAPLLLSKISGAGNLTSRSRFSIYVSNKKGAKGQLILKAK